MYALFAAVIFFAIIIIVVRLFAVVIGALLEILCKFIEHPIWAILTILIIMRFIIALTR